MDKLLIKLLLLMALAKVGMTYTDFATCHSNACLARLEQASRELVHIDWKPISVFPKEATRFQ